MNLFKTKADEQIAELEAEAERLWSLLDDISTLGDTYKPEINGYFKAVNGRCESRNGMITSDGYKLTWYADNLDGGE